MENYIRAVLYAYPYLETVGEDYAQHIKNKALLSYDSRMDVERLTEYLAEEILHKECLEWLKTVMDETFARLNELERKLLGMHFFGEKYDVENLGEKYDFKSWSVRKQVRFKEETYKKVGKMLNAAGLTKKTFEEELHTIEMIGKIYNRLLRKQKEKIA